MLGMTTTSDPGTTGIKDIADSLGGGLREKSLILLEGAPQTGKSVLSQHIAYGVMNARGSAVAYFSTDYKPEGLIEQMDSMGLATRHDFVTDRFRIYRVKPTEVIKDADYALKLILEQINEMPTRFKLVVVDSPSVFMTRFGTPAKVDFLQSCKELCGNGDRSMVLTLDTHVFETRTLLRAFAISDYYIKLKSHDATLDTGQIDTRIIKILEVTKLGGVERPGGSGLKFEIKPNVGIQILPFVRVKI
jgi:flagellar protein FlaH